MNGVCRRCSRKPFKCAVFWNFDLLVGVGWEGGGRGATHLVLEARELVDSDSLDVAACSGIDYPRSSILNPLCGNVGIFSFPPPTQL
jgi:hypothetical protein